MEASHAVLNSAKKIQTCSTFCQRDGTKGTFHKIDTKMTNVYMLANQMLHGSQWLNEDSEKHALKEHYKYPVSSCDLPIESPGPREPITNGICIMCHAKAAGTSAIISEELCWCIQCGLPC